MRYGWPGLVAFGLILSASSLSFAGEEAQGAKGSKSATTKRTDPKGITGISPFMELIAKGSASYVARDYATAVSTFQEAIQKAPNRALGHYMLGQAFLADKKPDQADGAWQTALRYAEKDPVLRAKTLFVIADLREQQQRWDDALTAWKAYADYVASEANAKGYPATPADRTRVVEKRKELETKYAKVKERIAQREQDAAAKAK
jgi:tetratricopeptide (TPR) repeat protein